MSFSFFFIFFQCYPLIYDDFTWIPFFFQFQNILTTLIISMKLNLCKLWFFLKLHRICVFTNVTVLITKSYYICMSDIVFSLIFKTLALLFPFFCHHSLTLPVAVHLPVSVFILLSTAHPWKKKLMNRWATDLENQPLLHFSSFLSAPSSSCAAELQF